MIIEFFTEHVRALAVGGLILDIFGALIVLGPELPLVARWATRYERDRLRRFASRLREGGTIHESEKDFEHLREVIIQNHNIGKWLFEFDLVSGNEDTVKLHGSDHGSQARFPLSSLEEWIEEYDGIEHRYFQLGAWLLFTGFSLQLVAEVGAVSGVVGMFLFLVLLGIVGGALISWRYWN